MWAPIIDDWCLWCPFSVRAQEERSGELVSFPAAKPEQLVAFLVGDDSKLPGALRAAAAKVVVFEPLAVPHAVLELVGQCEPPAVRAKAVGFEPLAVPPTALELVGQCEPLAVRAKVVVFEPLAVPPGGLELVGQCELPAAAEVVLFEPPAVPPAGLTEFLRPVVPGCPVARSARCRALRGLAFPSAFVRRVLAVREYAPLNWAAVARAHPDAQ
jgi:hypothetical protein